MNDFYWNDEVDFDDVVEDMDTDEIEFYNLALYFDCVGDGQWHALSPAEMLYRYDNFEEAFDDLRIITCEILIDCENEYLINITKLAPYEGFPFAYSITNEDGTGSYQWDEGDDYANELFNMSQKTMSKYFKRNRWVKELANNEILKNVLGEFLIKEYLIEYHTEKGWAFCTNEKEYENIREIAQGMNVRIQMESEDYVFIFQWVEDERIEVRLSDYQTIIEYDNAKEIVCVLKEEILSMIENRKAPVWPANSL